MPTPGDIEIPKLFGFPGFEALIRVNLKYVNMLLDNQGLPTLTYEEFRLEIETKTEEINNPTL